MSIGDNIKKWREIRNLKQSDLAELIGVSDKTVSSWEINRTEPKMGMVEKISAALNCKKTDIIGIDEQTDSDDETLQIVQEFFKKPDLLRIFKILKNSPEKKLQDIVYYLTDETPIIIEYMEPHKDERAKRLINYYTHLNEVGQKKALDNIEDLAKIYPEKKPDQYDFTISEYPMVAETSAPYLTAAHNDHLDEDGEMEKIQSDLSKLKRPQK